MVDWGIGEGNQYVKQQMLPCLVQRAAVPLSEIDNHVTIPPSTKVVYIKVIRLIFIVLDVQAV